MKPIRYIFGLVVLLMMGFVSCDDDLSVDLSNRKYVRINKPAVSLTVGEKTTLKAAVDSLGSAAKSFRWSVIDESVASIETTDNNSAIVTATGAGTTVIQIESTDGELKYFTDLSVAADRVIKILAIGNSFSEDAIENYLYDLAAAADHKVIISNLYIGGSPLSLHWENASGNKPAYQLRTINPDGSRTTFNDVSIEQAISGENWDYISFQQVSQESGQLEGYQEFLPKLVEYAQNLTSNPDLQFILHQTWAYAQDSNHFGFPLYNSDQMTMYEAIVDAVSKAENVAPIDLIVPAGTAIQNGRTSYIGDKFTRDGYHLNLNIGRFTAAAAWFEALFGGVLTNSFVPETLSGYDARLAKTAAHEAVINPGEVTILTDFEYPEPNEFELMQPLFIDFGPVESELPFNNFKTPAELKLSNLVDFTSQNTGFAIEVSEPFTGTLSRGLQNVLGLPTSVSEDMFFSDGIHIPQSGLTLSNLNREQKYTLVFYGSINDNRTETEYHVMGANEGNGYLDNDNNLGKLVVIRDIQPAEDATIAVRMKPGPNNTQFARFFGINAMMVLPEGMEVPVERNTTVLEEPVYIDFGIIEATAPFYHFSVASDAPRFDLPDATGNNTGFSMSVTARFGGANEFGAINNTLGFPSAVSQDAIYGDRNTSNSGFTLYNLNPTQEYQFVFYGSRRDMSDNRETKYEVIGANSGADFLDTTNNESEVAIVGGIKPTEGGTIDIVISAGPNNNNPDGFYYINTMIISPDGFILPGM